MWIGDAPMLPPSSNPVVMIAEASRGNEKALQSEKILGICRTMKVAESIHPLSNAQSYMYQFHHMDLFSDGATAKIIQPPKDGVLELSPYSDPSHYVYVYTPNPNPSPTGDWRKDSFVMSVENKGVTVQIRYYMNIQSKDEVLYELCDKPFWKISTTGSTPLDLATVEHNASLSALLANASQALTGFADLPNGALGQTTGTTITLDDNAAGWGWFIDATPGLNEEFLPTADPNVWIAKAGSEAEGKMDMLSVLLHEYGHTLGLDHSADSHDTMAATLQPGVRRTLSADDQLALMQLTGYFPTPDSPSDPFSPFLGTPLLFGLGRLRGSVLGSLTPTLSLGERGLKVQYEVVANPTLTNPEFAGSTGWSTTGTVSLSNGAAVLTESAAAQTRLNQLFVLGEHDRFLRFTLADIALDDVNSAPDDAFEVALIDADTGLSLLGGTGLTRSDALLNLQADGTERLASAVTSTLNADGSRTYLVDLAGVAAGTVASLSFDLIGFGRNAAAASSHVTVRDLKLGIPQTFDDAVTTAEDTPATIAALANDLDANQPGFIPVVVSGPAHGQVAVNADGSFGYTPDKDWFGEDSFSYKLSDSRVDSNVSTVSISVTPVNDAPVTAGMQLATLEDTPLVIDLLAQASDVDSTTLTAHIVDGPAHGVLAANADGTVTYTPNADFNGEDSFTYRVNDGELDSSLATVTVAVASVNDAPHGSSRWSPRWTRKAGPNR